MLYKSVALVSALVAANAQSVPVSSGNSMTPFGYQSGLAQDKGVDCNSALQQRAPGKKCSCQNGVCGDVTWATTGVSVTTNGMKINGKVVNGMNVFFGVPIAATTGGLNRWKAPQPWVADPSTEYINTDWSATGSDVPTDLFGTAGYDAFTETPCPQTGMAGAGGTEDCVSLDIYAAPGVTGMASVLWIHGGGFQSQSPSYNVFTDFINHPKYNFDGITNGGKTIFISMHYRLGVLGWMAHPGFMGWEFDGATGVPTYPWWQVHRTSGTAYASAWKSIPSVDLAGKSGNYGLKDSLHALNWISNNIVNFGGDASMVSVKGQSAGAAHTCMIMASPLAEGLVSAFIAQSPYISWGAGTYSYQARMEMNMAVTYANACAGDPTVPSAMPPLADNYTMTTTAGGASVKAAFSQAQCLRSKTMSDMRVNNGLKTYAGSDSTVVKTAFDNLFGTGGFDLYMYNTIQAWPTVDGFTLTMAPLEAYHSGVNKAAGVITGHGSDEYVLFCSSPPFWNTYSCGGHAGDPSAGDHAWILGQFYMPADASYSEILTMVNQAAAGSKFAALQSKFMYDDFVVTASTDAPNWHKWNQMSTDAWFAAGVNQVTEALAGAYGRTGGVYTYLSAADADSVQYPLLGACHGCELAYTLGFYSAGQSFISNFVSYYYNYFNGYLSQQPAVFPDPTYNTSALTNEDMAVALAYNGLWASMYYTASPNPGQITTPAPYSKVLPYWAPVTTVAKNTMVFSASVAAGAALNPCLRSSPCRTEPSAFYRQKAKMFFADAPSSINHNMVTGKCTAAPTVFNSHYNGAAVGVTCTYKPCCTFSSRRRSLLFGMPSTTTTDCDAMC